VDAKAMKFSQPKTLATKLVLIGACFLVLALGSIGLTLWVTWQLEGGAAAVNEAGRMRMQTWRLAAMVPTGNGTAERVRQFDESLDLLRDGDPSRPLFVPWDEQSRRSYAQVRTQWQQLRASWLLDPPPPPAQTALQATGFVDAIETLVNSVESQLARWTAILNLFQLALMALAIGGAVAMLYAGFLFVLDPLGRLKQGLQQVESGNLGTRISIASNDEFGALSDGFNRMASTLQGLYQNLEGRGQEKTASLEVQRGRLAALYEVSALLSRAGTLDEVASGFVTQVRRIAHADGAAIRWSNETNERYMLLAADGLPQSLLDSELCLKTGTCLCGNARSTSALRTIPILVAEPPPLGHCTHAGYQSLVSVPVRLQERILGEVTLLYKQPVTLSEEESSLLDSLASHLASAMESLRAQALEREAAVAEERGLLARELHDSIAQALAFLKIQVQLLRDALRRGDPPVVERVLGELDEGLRESTADVRELLVHFRTRTNSEDIEPALRSTLQKFEHQTGLPTHLALSGDGMPLDPDVQIQVLHVIQEALSNVRKHAGATQVWLSVSRSPAWRFEVRDDGRGFDEQGESADYNHVGLRIMRERAASIGARVAIDTRPGGGARVVLTLPARSDPSAGIAAA
jgi:two-component system, NarL family, nitrate/nitrite sensor histidine kinase NarX